MTRPLIAVDARYGLRAPRRGVGEYVYQVYRALADLPRSYDVVLYGDGSAEPEIVKDFSALYPVRLFPDHPFAIWEQWAWPHALRRDRAEVTHGTANIGPLLWHGKIVLTVHDVIEWHRGTAFPSSIAFRHRLSRLYRMNTLKRLVRRADAILTVSDHAQGDISRTLKISRQRIRVTPLASKISPMAPNYRKDGYFLVLGALDPRKNLEGALRAFAKCQFKEVRLKVVGLEPSAVKSARALVTQYRLDGRVDLQEMISDDALHALYKKAMGFLYLSLYEGFGLPVLEAMALGCPVIGSNRTAVRDVVGVDGLLVDPQNFEEVALAMDRLVRDESLRGILIQRGLKSAEYYSWEKTAIATHEVFEEVLRAKS